MTSTERELIITVRRALLHLHKTLLDWERKAYDRAHGRLPPGQLLRVVMTDPQFAWLRPISELIVRMDGALEMEAPGAVIDVDGIIAQARALVAPDGDSSYGQRYHAALQELPEAVLAHGAVTTILKNVPRPQERPH